MVNVHKLFHRSMKRIQGRQVGENGLEQDSSPGEDGEENTIYRGDGSAGRGVITEAVAQADEVHERVGGSYGGDDTSQNERSGQESGGEVKGEPMHTAARCA